jgi:hypothetical protein
VSRNPVRRDTRKHARATLELPVVVSDAANRVSGGIRFASADVSGGGAFLRSDLLFEVGEILTLEFDLPGGRHVRARGRVVRVSRGQHPQQDEATEPKEQGADPAETNGKPRRSSRDRFAGMGVEFVDLSPEDRAAIEAGLA